jgi:RNA polymerase sigma factor (sigma-70 family)
VDAIAAAIIKRLPPCFELDDLKQAGRIGLIAAAASYSRARNVPFACYARIRIRGEILEACRRRNWREAVRPELTGEMIDCITIAGDDGERSVEQQEKARLLALALDGLSEQDRQALTLYYLQNRKLEEVGLALDLSASRAGQIVRRALERARRELAFHGVKTAA